MSFRRSWCAEQIVLCVKERRYHETRGVQGLERHTGRFAGRQTGEVRARRQTER